MKRTARSGTASKSFSWEKRIETALMLGDFISWDEVSEFRDDLANLLDELVSFMNKRPKDVLPVLKIFMAGCLEKGDEIDDSGDDLGTILDELARVWTECCAQAGVEADENSFRIVAGECLSRITKEKARSCQSNS